MILQLATEGGSVVAVLGGIGAATATALGGAQFFLRRELRNQTQAGAEKAEAEADKVRAETRVVLQAELKKAYEMLAQSRADHAHALERIADLGASLSAAMARVAELEHEVASLRARVAPREFGRRADD